MIKSDWTLDIIEKYRYDKQKAMLDIYRTLREEGPSPDAMNGIYHIPLCQCTLELLVAFAMGLNAYIGVNNPIRIDFCNRVKSIHKLNPQVESIFA